jgi:predicted nucleic acid-binding protein
VVGLDGSLLYLDASALVKLVITEQESAALRIFIAGDPLLISSRIGAVELRRVAARQDEQPAEPQVDAVLANMLLVEVDELVAASAGTVAPTSLRTLDAIHLASAMTLAPELDALITYDARLADAARAAGLNVVAPA